MVRSGGSLRPDELPERQKVLRQIYEAYYQLFLTELAIEYYEKKGSSAEKYMDEKHKFHLEQAEPIIYSHGSYFGCGELLGTFGYSVKKR